MVSAVTCFIDLCELHYIMSYTISVLLRKHCFIFPCSILENLCMKISNWQLFRVGPRRPSSDWTGGRSIANYIKQVAPGSWNGQLDYALITHFHDDHYGYLEPNTKYSKTGKVKTSPRLCVSEICTFVGIVMPCFSTC